MNYYAGIGSRTTPLKVCERMAALASRYAREGYILRSGGAQGADAAFAKGAGTSAEILLATPVSDAAIEIARIHHPAWDKCNEYARRLLGRNAMILLGLDLMTPVEFVVCWIPLNVDRGGTVLVTRIAKTYGIPVFNLADSLVFAPGEAEALKDLVRGHLGECF